MTGLWDYASAQTNVRLQDGHFLLSNGVCRICMFVYSAQAIKKTTALLWSVNPGFQWTLVDISRHNRHYTLLYDVIMWDRKRFQVLAKLPLFQDPCKAPVSKPAITNVWQGSFFSTVFYSLKFFLMQSGSWKFPARTCESFAFKKEREREKIKYRSQEVKENSILDILLGQYNCSVCFIAVT